MPKVACKYHDDMKIAITGHKRGIGKAFAVHLEAAGHDIVGISRSDGENIRRTAHTASVIEPCDIFINNAQSGYAQTELLFEVWHRWRESKGKEIWNISTQLCEQDRDYDIPGLTMRESMQYRNNKMSLELAHRQLEQQRADIRMRLVRPGNVATWEHSTKDAMPADQYAESVLREMGMIR